MEQKKLMAVLVLGQQCTLGNYKHKGKDLGLYSAQLSQIMELEEAEKGVDPQKRDAIKQINGEKEQKKRRRKEKHVKERKRKTAISEIKGEVLTF